MNYKGYEIQIKPNPKNKEYPYIAVARKGLEVIEKRGYDEQQAIDLVESLIDFTLGIQEIKNK
ncbi:hypothetical protein [Clostridium tyrobutyricum]|jgi:hypothetical protein|uniref:hypothetical protein n=1 Tax=Clostridium tyrobutyricum TaxID=1519 RepID=UPI000E80E8DF|nr:hypothetical protein [Clostridium tyrobutyricum]HBN28375.1 hypothetical protein [Clostridiaceae bacterium]